MLSYSFHLCLSICDILDLGQEDNPYLKINEKSSDGHAHPHAPCTKPGAIRATHYPVRTPPLPTPSPKRWPTALPDNATRPQKNMSRPRPTEDIVDSLQQNEMPQYLLLFALKIAVPYVSLWICVRAGFFAQMARHLGNFKQRRSSLCMGYF